MAVVISKRENNVSKIHCQESQDKVQTAVPERSNLVKNNEPQKKYPYECNVHVKKDETNGNRG